MKTAREEPESELSADNEMAKVAFEDTTTVVPFFSSIKTSPFLSTGEIVPTSLHHAMALSALENPKRCMASVSSELLHKELRTTTTTLTQSNLIVQGHHRIELSSSMSNSFFEPIDEQDQNGREQCTLASNTVPIVSDDVLMDLALSVSSVSSSYADGSNDLYGFFEDDLLEDKWITSLPQIRFELDVKQHGVCAPHLYGESGRCDPTPLTVLSDVKTPIVKEILQKESAVCSTTGERDKDKPVKEEDKKVSKQIADNAQKGGNQKTPKLIGCSKSTSSKTRSIDGSNPISENEISIHDVLCGRGGLGNNHPGNKCYHEEKIKLQPYYWSTTDLEEKKAISCHLVNLVHEKGGRFLRKERGQWYELPFARARKKASQALREVNTPEVRAKKRARYGPPDKKPCKD